MNPVGIDPLSIIDKSVWAVVAIVGLIFGFAALRDVARGYFTSASVLRRRQFRAQDWAPYEALNTTETVATVVAAAVAVRAIKQQEHAMTREDPAEHLRRVTADPTSGLDFQQLRRIVRRMTASIRSGEARWLRGKQIAWVHSVDAEDEFERSALQSLGATVQFFDDNATLLSALGRADDQFDVIVTNKRHYLEARATRGSAKPTLDAGAQLLAELGKRHNKLPVIVYSRSLEHNDWQHFLGPLQASACVAYPEDFIHAVLMATKPDDTEKDRARPSQPRPLGEAPVLGKEPPEPPAPASEAVP